MSALSLRAASGAGILVFLLSFAAQATSMPQPVTAPVTFTNMAHVFDDVAAATEGMKDADRVAVLRQNTDAVFPGLYDEYGRSETDGYIVQALKEFPQLRPVYRNVVTRFPAVLDDTLIKFRNTFADFVPPYPVYLAHDLGARDGGTTIIRGRNVMIFGADMIAKLHNDESMQPFMEHELFHLEHARHFSDCDQFWCSLWQEGLAVYVASTFTPGATDHQLLLDIPADLHTKTDVHWGEALCQVAKIFDGTDKKNYYAAFNYGEAMGTLPRRYGYYVGYRLVQQATKHNSLSGLDHMNNETARPVVRAALMQMMLDAHTSCAVPAASAPVTHAAANPA